ncbi:putative membrane protein required for colicin V production [Virgibacillus natechei]|uniref:Membrane protein required for colicin V production n=1 Tax=Virgibacillus natechei TaxID=1216297 RepID=A0ABS4IDB1_9BACI|nr:CvpA family protein [Virgibacillus natechei]MBP1968843.1 putative membrane protein required for colicin V production [Virgibacillus natechei]UZD11641.1 CvpA family protein [Virgibacillus natechei]
MFDLILIVLLILGFLIGLRRGFILQLFHLVGFVVAFIVAVLYYDVLGERISLWIPYPQISNDSAWAEFLQSLPLESGFYNAIAFAIIFFAVKILLQIIASMLDFVAYLPVLKSINKILGAVLGFLEIYLILFIVLYILALTPVEGIQSWINNSFIALFIIENTPYFSDKITDLWFTHVPNLFNN